MMARLSNVVCLVIHRNVIHRFIVQALQDPPLCSSTAKIVRKTLIPTVLLLLFDFLSLENDGNVPSKSNKHKNFLTKIIFLLAS